MTMTKNKYNQMYRESIHDPESFWGKQSEYLTWMKKWKTVYRGDFARGINEWFIDGKLNASMNCIDRHLEKHAEKNAIIWQGEIDSEEKHITYRELFENVCQIADLLTKLGIRKGDRALIYMPMIPELAYAVLACARIGVVHSVVFAGFSAQAIAHRIDDCTPSIIINANAGIRGGKTLAIKKIVDQALKLTTIDSSNIKQLIFRYSKKSNTELEITEKKDDLQFWWDQEVAKRSLNKQFPPVEMDAEDPLFILYTSGSTGKPKGILHTTGGYLLGTSLTFRTIFNYKENDVYWCTADIGWITGHSYVLYGPLACGATTLMYEGAPQYPDIGRFWQIVEKHKVAIFYTAPTAIRAFMKESIEFVRKYNLNSLHTLGTVGEPINPEAWHWYNDNIGQGRCPIADTWWQTETGAIMISNIQNIDPLKPGSAGLPFFGIKPILVDQNGKLQTIMKDQGIFQKIWGFVCAFFGISQTTDQFHGEKSGALCIQNPWPSMCRGIYGKERGFYDTYMAQYPGLYFSGDRATVDKEGYFWLNGRMDDVLNVSGHRLGTAEVESAIICHSSVSESAVVSIAHPIKGEGIYAFVTLKSSVTPSHSIAKEISNTITQQIGKIARPEYIQWAPSLPKTRSGKIMRRLLRQIAHQRDKELGDMSTLADDNVIKSLIVESKNKINLGT